MMTLGCIGLQPGFWVELKSGHTKAVATSPRVPPGFKAEQMGNHGMVLNGTKKKNNKET
jgi:hypothetical protein